MNQEATVGGTGHTIVQIVGDGNSVVTGHPHLMLTRYWGRRQVRQDLDRLAPYTRSTTLRGRDAELASLQAFLADARPIGARVLTGGGGSGKTRLALELCEQVSGAGTWDAGFVTGAELGRFFDAQNLGAWGWRKPTLIVVDYAAQQARLLGQWFDELADRPEPPAHPLRLLLLERSASTEGGWWSTVFASGGWGALSKRALLDPPEPIELAPLVSLDDRLGLVADMVTQANAGRTPDWLLNDPGLREKLAQIDSGGDPLFLMMAALEMLRAGHARALTLTRTDLAKALAGREADRLKGLARMHRLSPELVQHLAVCITLAQGMERREFETFAEAEKQAIGRPGGGDAAALADVLQEALPAREGIAPVLPDLIGEALILGSLKQGKGSDAVLRCHAHAAARTAQTVIRCAQDFAPAEQAPLQWLQGLVQARWSDVGALAELQANLPLGSVVLADEQLRVARRISDLAAGQPDSPAEVRAPAQGRLALALAEVGQLEAALAVAQESAELYRELAAQRPDAFRAALAGALNNLANRRSELGQREAALTTAQESAELYRELAAQRPDVFRADLALSLNNLANRFSDLGRHEVALAAGQESAELYRELAAQRPDVFRADLATSLNNMANILSDLGQREAALAVAQESVELYRELAAQRPDVFRADLALSLNNLANRLSDLGQREAALAAVQESVELRRELAAQRPDVFRANLAMSLNNLATMLGELGQREAALAAVQEAVDLHHELAAQRPDVFRASLAMSLHNLASMLSKLGRFEAALAAAQESAELYRELAAQRPDVFRASLALSLNNQAAILGDLGQHEAALAAAQEAVELRRELAAQRPDVFRTSLATSLIVLALLTQKTRTAIEALPWAQEAVQLLAPAFVQRPQVHWQLMRAMLRDYLSLCKSAEVEPDAELLEQLLPYFPS